MHRHRSLPRMAVAALVLAGCAAAAPDPAEPPIESARLPGRQAAFDVRHQIHVKAPEGTRELRIWAALPQESDPYQRIRDLKVTAPLPHRVTRDSEGNTVLFLSSDGAALPREFDVVTTFRVERDEVRYDVRPEGARPLTAEDRARLAHWLEPNKNVVIDDKVRAIAAEVVGGETNPVLASRRIYDWVLRDIDYWVKDPANKKASPVGSSEYCLTSKTGNCTDFHSLYAAVSRAAGIPTRMVYGSFLKKSLDGKDADQSYHCWIEFFAPGKGWVPLDVAVADVFVGDFALNAENESKVKLTTAAGYDGADPAMVDYYFGNLDERRVVWSTGRDLVVDPPAAAGPLNHLVKAHVEADGRPLAEKLTEKEGWSRKLTFAEVR